MKKILIFLLCLVMTLSLFACGSKTDTKTTTAGETTSKTYKETLKGYDSLTPASRVVCFQNALGTSEMDEFGFGEAPVVSAGGYDKAYSVKCCTNFFTNKVDGDVTVIDTALKSTTFTAAEYEAAFIAIADDGSGVFISGTKTVVNLKYVVTNNGEGIVYVPASTTYTCGDILSEMGLSVEATSYRFVAVDKFYNAEAADVMKTTEVRGTLSGAVNCAVDNGQGYGKMNDFIFIEIVS